MYLYRLCLEEFGAQLEGRTSLSPSKLYSPAIVAVFPSSRDAIISETHQDKREKEKMHFVCCMMMTDLPNDPTLSLLDPRFTLNPAASMTLLKHKLDEVSPLPAEFKRILSCSKSKP